GDGGRHDLSPDAPHAGRWPGFDLSGGSPWRAAAQILSFDRDGPQNADGPARRVEKLHGGRGEHAGGRTMTRALFIARLRQGLKGLSADEIADIVLDYEAHCSDADVAASLGDPLQLGQEIAAESKLRRWEKRRSPHNFLRAGFALAGLQTFNLLVVLPVLALILFCA